MILVRRSWVLMDQKPPHQDSDRPPPFTPQFSWMLMSVSVPEIEPWLPFRGSCRRLHACAFNYAVILLFRISGASAGATSASVKSAAVPPNTTVF